MNIIDEDIREDFPRGRIKRTKKIYEKEMSGIEPL